MHIACLLADPPIHLTSHPALTPTPNSLDLVAITCSITILILIIDLYGNSAAGQPFWTHGLCHIQRKNTTYVAQCQLKGRKRRELQKKLARGDNVCIGDVLRLRNQSMSSSSLTNSSSGSLGGRTLQDGEEAAELRRRENRARGDEEWMGGTY